VIAPELGDSMRALLAKYGTVAVLAALAEGAESCMTVAPSLEIEQLFEGAARDIENAARALAKAEPEAGASVADGIEVSMETDLAEDAVAVAGGVS
jgi:hypothetical protein